MEDFSVYINLEFRQQQQQQKQKKSMLYETCFFVSWLTLLDFGDS